MRVFLIAVLLSFLYYGSAQAQLRAVVHQPEASLELEGLLRPFSPTLARYTIELHPGWLKKETYDSLTTLSTLLCVDPTDTLVKFLGVVSHPYRRSSYSNDSIAWERVKEQVRTGYGDKGIAIKELSQSILPTQTPDNGILAEYELLAKMSDHLEYVAVVMSINEAILITAPLSKEEYAKRIDYFRKISQEIKNR